MHRSNSFRFSTAALTVAISLLVLFLPAVWAQNAPSKSDPVLAPGKPPLTQSMVTSTIDFRAWVLEIPFTPQQRAMILQNARHPQGSKTNAIWAILEAEMMGGLNPEDSEFDQVNFQEKAVKALRADTGNPESQWLIAAYDAAHPPIAAGDPPLTESMVSHYTTFMAWLLEVPLTQDFKNYQRAMLIRDWKDPKDRAGDLVWLKLELDLSRYQHGSAERAWWRSVTQPKQIDAARADTKNPDAQYMVAAYDAAHRPIATGAVPLTRQASDAWAELYCFASTQKGVPMVASPAAKDEFAKVLTQKFPTFSAADQKSFAQMTQVWPGMHMTWLTGTPAVQQKIVAGWESILAPPDPQLNAAQMAQDRVTAFMAKDPNSATRQEMLSTAKDSDLVALQYRRQGGKSDLSYAASYEELSATLHTGEPQAFLNMLAQWRANGEMVAIMRAQSRARFAANAATAMRNAVVSMNAATANIIENMGNSPYRTVVRPK
jgi:hypothetical protein